MKRKTISNFLGMCLIVFLATAVSFLSTSCEKFSKSQDDNRDVSDSIMVANEIDAIINPSFTSVSDVTEFQGRLIEEYSVDEVFRTLPREILSSIAQVCLKRDNTITKADIVLEYRANYEIYNSLFEPTIETTDTTITETVVEEQQLPAPTSVSYYYKIDTIDGKPVKVLVKEETYESK